MHRLMCTTRQPRTSGARSVLLFSSFAQERHELSTIVGKERQKKLAAHADAHAAVRACVPCQVVCVSPAAENDRETLRPVLPQSRPKQFASRRRQAHA